ncbi:alpha/beta hydrolase family protein [Sandaracinobacteroides hominis]|uniref:alpha/beta hydrolase family protein n=1 Tax=Sandaracinobacteroides hominis TaxID=2780086 RepID=UPI0018F674B6|nr:alpha/beta hydrolase [Sandaracinobacteroides hominis]
MSFQLDRRALLGALAATALPLRAAAIAEPLALTLKTATGRPSQISHWPAQGRSRGTILFSHGAFSAPRFYTDLYAPWIAAGFDIFAPLHIDSREHPDAAKYPPMASWGARLQDMRTLSAHVGKPYLAAGHSYGGLVALTLGGASSTPPEGFSPPLRDAKAKAVVAFSPPGPMPGLIAREGFATLATPAFIQTGTKDVPPGPPGAPVDPEGWGTHLAAFEEAAPGNSRYALVIDGVDHYFGGAICRPDVPGPPQLKELAEAGRLSTLFLKSYGSGDKAAGKSLQNSLSDAGPFRLSRK